MKKKLHILFFLFFLSTSLFAKTNLNAKTSKVVAGPTPDTKGILYIKSGGTGDGSSWNNALGNFQTAMTSTNAAILQVWVAAGTYSPNYGSSFSLKEGVKIYGGFIGTENDLSQRDWKTNISILRGNRNSVVKTVNQTSATVLDGFTISDGYIITDSSGNGGLGGGINNNSGSSLSISNCIFKNNTATGGGGIYNSGGFPTITNCTFINNSSSAIENRYTTPTITNCNFEKNVSYASAIENTNSTVTFNNCNFTENSGQDGGAMYNENSTVTLTNCHFLKNISTTGTSGNNGGAAMFNVLRCNIKIYNCSFIENSAARYGGAIVSNNSTNLTIVNSLFANNTAQTAANELYNTSTITLNIINSTFINNGPKALYITSGAMNFKNCIVWSETYIPYPSTYTSKNSLLLGKTDTTNGNISSTGISDTQIFNSPSTGDYSLLEGGIVINKGDNALYDSSIFGNLDLAGKSRINETTIDLGAYESKNGSLSVANIETPTLRVYPNPIKGDFFTIENVGIDGDAILYDLSGKEVKSVKIENGKAQINVSNLSNGIFLLKTTKGGALKIMIE